MESSADYWQRVHQEQGTPSREDLQAYLDAPKPKIHFCPTQHFAPRSIVNALIQYPDLDPNPDELPISTDDIVAKVKAHYTLPFAPYDYQAAAINALSTETAVGLWFEVGGGKTLTGSIMALYHRIQSAGTIMVVMPPILLKQWARFFQAIPEIQSVLIYRGTPSQRQKLDLDVDVILLSMDIFKNDFERLYDFYLNKNLTLIVDEAVSVKNHQTSNHQCVWAMHNQDLSKYQQYQKRKAENKAKRARKASQKATTEDTLAQTRKKILEAFKR